MTILPIPRSTPDITFCVLSKKPAIAKITSNDCIKSETWPGRMYAPAISDLPASTQAAMTDQTTRFRRVHIAARRLAPRGSFAPSAFPTRADAAEAMPMVGMKDRATNWRAATCAARATVPRRPTTSAHTSQNHHSLLVCIRQGTPTRKYSRQPRQASGCSPSSMRRGKPIRGPATNKYALIKNHWQVHVAAFASPAPVFPRRSLTMNSAHQAMCMMEQQRLISIGGVLMHIFCKNLAVAWNWKKQKRASAVVRLYAAASSETTGS
mmetsp:Transcript_65765/g.183176  ORF Transcript_65765/g.183176 Transcript_65765/m.183176 type:complete len:266 (+) Transcript_65765:250-1047(+)